MALRIWLPLNGSLENKGISDITVTNNGATIDNNGKIGKCYNFDGTNGSWINTNYSYNTIGKNWSITCWVKPTGTGTIVRANTKYSPIIDFLGTNNGLRAFYWYSTNSYYMISLNKTKTPDNIWTHIALISNGLTMSLYLNGVLESTINISGNPNPYITGTMQIGNCSTLSGSLFHGSINDVRIYDHCLSPLEVKEISQGLVLHYKLDNCVNDGNDNLLLRTKMDADAQAEFVANSSTDFTKLFRYYNGNAGLHTFSETIGGGFEDTVALSTTGNLGIAFVRANSELNLDPNSYYTLSCEAKCTSASKKLAIGTSYRTTSNGWVWRGGSNAQSFTGVDTWQTFQYTFKPDSNILYICYCFTVSGSANGTDTFTIRHCKLEKGSVATKWSPAPEEGIIFNKIVDSSGYGNDGILSEYRKLYLSSDSKRYNKSIYLPKEKYATNTGFYFPMLIERVDIPECTLCLWVKPEDEFSGHSPGIYDGYFWVMISDKDTLNLKMSSTFSHLSSKPHITFNEWNFISLVYKDKTLYGYVNGEYIGSFALQDYEHIYPTQIAGEYHHLGSYFVGKMSDIRLYHTALSAEDIATLYHTPAQVDNLGGIHGFEFIEKTSNLLNPDLREWSKENNVTCVWNEETKYFDVNTNRDTSNNSRWGIFQNITVKPNTSYLFAVDMMGTGSAMGIAAQDTTTTWPGDKNTAGDAKRYYYILTTTATNTVGRIYLNIKPSINQIAHFKNIYLGEIGEIASIKQNGTFENEDMIEYNENGRITKSGELAGSNFIEK